jgi:hypothetical protein
MARPTKLMKNLLLCQLELVHYQKKAPSPRSREHHVAMGMMSRLAVVPEELILL